MFIRNADISKGSIVKLTEDCTIPTGIFTQGHIFRVRAMITKGYDLVDLEGRKLDNVPRYKIKLTT